MHQEHISIRVYLEDTDAGGIVFNGSYINYFERARTEYLRAHGIQQQAWLEKGVQLVLSRLECRYVKPARLDDLLTVVTWISQRRKVLCRFSQEVWRDDELLVCGEADVACLSTKTGRPIRYPADFVQCMT